MAIATAASTSPVATDSQEDLFKITALVSADGQVAIPEELLLALNLKEGDRVSLVRDGNSIRVSPIGSVVARTAGILTAYGKNPPPTIKELKEAAAQAIADDVMERMNRSHE